MHHIKTYTVTLIPLPDGFQAVCQAMADCVVTGTTKEEALERIEDVIRSRIAEATVKGRPVPEDRTSTKFLWINVEEFLV